MKKTEKQKNSLSSTNWHAKDLDFALKETNSSIVGLTTAEVQKRLAMYGENSLPQKKSKSVFLIFLQEILNPIVLILVFAMFFSFIVGEILDAFVILAIVMIDAVIGTVQSKKAERIANSLSNMIKVKSKVLRDGNKTEVEYDTLLAKPEDPTKAATETTVYTFKGWFDGEKEWHFETDKVKKDTALVAKFDEADRLYIVTVKYTGVEKTDGEIKAKYNEEIDFIDFELDGYTYKVTKGGAEITELTVKGDDEITVTYEKKADPKPTESEDLSESGNDSETNKPTGSESIKDSKTEEKSGCFGNVAGASAGVFAALIAAVAILRKRR